MVGGIGFAVDGFDTHVFFDPIRNGTIRARDLRLRFEFEGDAVSRLPQAPAQLSDPWTLHEKNFSVSFVVAHAVWGDTQAYWDQGEAEGKRWLDVILYAGEEQEFRLAELSAATCALAVRCLPGAGGPLSPKMTCDGGRISLAVEDLKIAYAAKPLPLAKLCASFSSSIAPSSSP